MTSHGGKSGAVVELITITEVGDTGWNRDAGQCAAGAERVSSDAGDTGGNRDAVQ